ncbi:hypothetical protein [Flavobacterium sp. 140616W15]|uniref:hypothetical protein n=1 Tax=Flavobacterium sp. 140616W15 TaxID=2478552 RepID=UPI000F0D1CB2|nr:hypothetical protein [Flavobacterium sp. 140616W15]AYN03970.1 hypothetical protein EAG11_07015 [Flavobacterium sp. 140616W15]
MVKKYIIGFVIVGVVLFIFLNTFIRSRNEYQKSYNFIITKVEITPTHTLEVFNNNEKIAFWNYIISENEGVEIGDLIYKKKCSKYLYIYKKNEMGKYEEHLKVNLSSLFPIEWFCNN